jgi:hypothetical protein
VTYSSTYVINPSFAFFRQWAGSQREDRVVELEIMREESEEIDEPVRQLLFLV